MLLSILACITRLDNQDSKCRPKTQKCLTLSIKLAWDLNLPRLVQASNNSLISNKGNFIHVCAAVLLHLAVQASWTDHAVCSTMIHCSRSTDVQPVALRGQYGGFHMCNHTNTNEQLLCASLQMMSDPVKEGCQLRLLQLGLQYMQTWAPQNWSLSLTSALDVVSWIDLTAQCSGAGIQPGAELCPIWSSSACLHCTAARSAWSTR